MDRRGKWPTEFFERGTEAQRYCNKLNQQFRNWDSVKGTDKKARFSVKRFLVVLKGEHLDFYEHSWHRSEKVNRKTI